MGLAAEAQPVIGLAFLPVLHLHHQVNVALRLHGAHAVNVAHVDHADAPQLHVVADQLRRGANQIIPVDALDVHRVVGDEPVAPLDQLQGRLALADAAVTHQQHALAVNLHQHAVGGDAGGQMGAQGGDQVGLKLRGVAGGEKHIAVILLRHFQTFGEGLGPVTDHQGADVILHELLKGLAPVLRGKRIQICTFHPSYYLYAVGVKVIIKAGELHGRAVHVGGLDEDGLVILGGVQRLELMLLYQGLQLYGIFTDHGGISNHRYKILPYILPIFRRFGNCFFTPGCV